MLDQFPKIGVALVGFKKGDKRYRRSGLRLVLDEFLHQEFKLFFFHFVHGPPLSERKSIALRMNRADTITNPSFKKNSIRNERS